MRDLDRMDETEFKITGAGRRRTANGLSSHVPVRFSPEMIEAVKRLADEDGLTVSSWIRGLVSTELERRVPARTGRSLELPPLELTGLQGSVTVASRPSETLEDLLTQ